MSERSVVFDQRTTEGGTEGQRTGLSSAVPTAEPHLAFSLTVSVDNFLSCAAETGAPLPLCFLPWLCFLLSTLSTVVGNAQGCCQPVFLEFKEGFGSPVSSPLKAGRGAAFTQLH